MKKSVAKLSGIVVGVIGIMAILAGCSQGFSSGNSGTPSNPPSSTRPGSTSSTPASTGPSSKSNVAYRPKTFNPKVAGSTVSLSLAEVAQAGNGNFFINNMSFMAYQLDGTFYVRADVCVPCGSRTFTLQNGTLICGSCGTVFNATTGAGMRGVSACMSYAKKAAPYTTDSGNMVITMNDLTTAYQNTMNRRG